MSNIIMPGEKKIDTGKKQYLDMGKMLKVVDDLINNTQYLKKEIDVLKERVDALEKEKIE